MARERTQPRTKGARKPRRRARRNVRQGGRSAAGRQTGRGCGQPRPRSGLEEPGRQFETRRRTVRREGPRPRQQQAKRKASHRADRAPAAWAIRPAAAPRIKSQCRVQPHKEAPPGEDPNLEYARKATDLALDKLKDQLKKPAGEQTAVGQAGLDTCRCRAVRQTLGSHEAGGRTARRRRRCRPAATQRSADESRPAAAGHHDRRRSRRGDRQRNLAAKGCGLVRRPNMRISIALTPPARRNRSEEAGSGQPAGSMHEQRDSK